MNSILSDSGNLFTQKKVEISSKKQSNFCLQEISLTGSISSIKRNTILYAKNNTECEYIYLLEFEPSVYRYYEKPFVLTFYKGNQRQSFIPNFLVEYWNGDRSLVQVHNGSEPSFIDGHKTCISDFCKKNSIDYKVISKEEINPQQLFNATFLLSYRKPKFGFNTNDLQIVTDKLQESGQITVQQLLDFAVQDEHSKSTLLYVIWYMVSHHQICFDSENMLGMNTKLWLENF